MTQAWLVGASLPVPQDDTAARSTLEPVRTDGPAEEQAPPDWNEFDSDDSPQLVGLSPRATSSDTHDATKYAPWWASLEEPVQAAIAEQNVTWAEKGTAAARELAGQQGHGTMQTELGIEPVIRDGAAYGSGYFITVDKPIQDGMGRYMEPPDEDNFMLAVAQARGVSGEVRARQSTLYDNFLRG